MDVNKLYDLTLAGGGKIVIPVYYYDAAQVPTGGINYNLISYHGVPAATSYLSTMQCSVLSAVIYENNTSVYTPMFTQTALTKANGDSLQNSFVKGADYNTAMGARLSIKNNVVAGSATSAASNDRFYLYTVGICVDRSGGARLMGLFFGVRTATNPSFTPNSATVPGYAEFIIDTVTFAMGATYINDIDDFLDGIIEEFKVDPYSPGGESDKDGGDGDFNKSSDPVPVPSLPSVSAVDTGFITLYNPTLAQVKALADYMWSTGFDLDTFKKLFADPMDVILGLTIVPVSIPSGGSGSVSVGNISTGVTMNIAGQQYIEFDCGSLTLNEFWGAYLDYSPYTKVEIYLPFIGTKTLDIDDVMKKTVNVVYHIDILSGSCVAFIKSGDHVIYSFTGQCAAQIPVNSADMNNLISSVITAAAAIGGAIVTGGAALPVTAAAASTARAVVSAKPTIDRSGDMSGYSGLLGIQKPYFIISRPKQCLPSSQNVFMGYPAFITRALSAVSGYTEIESIHLSVPGATGEELTEIESLLKSGVII